VYVDACRCAQRQRRCADPNTEESFRVRRRSDGPRNPLLTKRTGLAPAVRYYSGSWLWIRGSRASPRALRMTRGRIGVHVVGTCAKLGLWIFGFASFARALEMTRVLYNK